MNRKYLMDMADVPIRYNLQRTAEDGERLLQNSEVSEWFSRLALRSQASEIGDIHGSHDYRMENILGKCWILGLSKDIPVFAEKMKFITGYLDQHVKAAPPDDLSFGKLYHYRDHEKVLSCFLPLLGYHEEPAVLHIVRQRIDILYTFARQKRYDIYVNGAALRGVKKEWQPYIIDPALYADGHIALPDMHDFLLFAGMYPYLSDEEKERVEVIVGWLFGEGYGGIIRRYGYFYIPGGSYSTKAITFKLHLPDIRGIQSMDLDKTEHSALVFTVFVLSHFKTARESEWFALAMQYLEQYQKENGRYCFPADMITEKPDSYVIFGGHMNVGENKRAKSYREIISTYWMERIKKE